MTRIDIADITLRDLEQEYSSKLSFKEKLEIAKLLEKLKVDIIETGFINEPGDEVFVRTLAASLEHCILSVPVTADKQNIDKARTALTKASKGRLNLIMPTSTVGMEYGYQMKAEKMLPLAGELVSYAVSVCDDVEFTAEDALRSEPEFLASILKAAVSAGAKTITLCDSAGELLPDEFTAFMERILKMTPELSDVTLAFHFKDNIRLAHAIALIGINLGVRAVKVSAGTGFDTLSLKRFLNIIKLRGETLGISCGANITELSRICARLAAMTGFADIDGKSAQRAAPSAKPDAAPPDGADINQLRGYISSIGYDISEDDLERIFAQYADIARSKKVVADDIEALIAETAGQAPATYKLGNFVINSGSSIVATAYVEFIKAGAVNAALSAGDGPIDAAFKAAEIIFGTHYELEDFQIHAVTSGREATGDALIKLRHEGKLYSGRGVSTDIVGASIRAYLSAVNKILHEEAGIK
ncbi:MAG: hypothetical protein FWH17_02335 [Oscillospiraceae bacterium]|nr:hypothetical protein [Oscillospiraceae bacterium]